MRMPNLNALRMFDAAARHGSFQLAAAELHLTQGAVAQQVRRLEADLGLRLFDRQARGVALSAVGRAYHPPVRRALAMIAEATRALRPVATQVTLSVTPSLAAKWLVPRLAGFSRAHPGIELQILAAERLADFGSDGVDLAIRQGRAPSGADLAVEMLAPVDLCAVASPDVADRLTGAGLAELAREPLIGDSHDYWQKLFEAAGLAPQYRPMKFNQTALAMDAAAGGQGVALAPWILACDDVQSGRLRLLWREPASNGDGFYLVHPKGRRDPALVAVVAWAVANAPRSVPDA